MTSGHPSALSRGPMPPFVKIRDFLPASKAAALLEWATENEARFKPTYVRYGTGQRIDPRLRISVSTENFGPIKEELRDHFLEMAKDVIRGLRVNSLEIADSELEIVAHNDGMFFSRHVDTVTGANTGGEMIRFLSAVYYVFRQPTPFSGGALRLHRFGAQTADDFVDITPEHNTLVAFPSWALHEVLPVSCPSGLWSNSRFAVNIWLSAPRV